MLGLSNLQPGNFHQMTEIGVGFNLCVQGGGILRLVCITSVTVLSVVMGLLERDL